MATVVTQRRGHGGAAAPSDNQDRSDGIVQNGGGGRRNGRGRDGKLPGTPPGAGQTVLDPDPHQARETPYLEADRAPPQVQEIPFAPGEDVDAVQSLASSKATLDSIPKPQRTRPPTTIPKRSLTQAPICVRTG